LKFHEVVKQYDIPSRLLRYAGDLSDHFANLRKNFIRHPA